MKSSSVRRLTVSAMCVAVLVICAWLTVPAPVPFTMQTFAVFAVLGILGGKYGTVCICSYLLLGAFALPVFSGFSGGVGVLLGPTGGYLLGFLLIALLFWLCESIFGSGDRVFLLSCFVGLALCYLAGTLWYVYVYLRSGTVTLWAALGTNVLPFVVPDTLKLLLALTVRKRIKKLV